jgi:hypothetical protein
MSAPEAQAVLDLTAQERLALRAKRFGGDAAPAAAAPATAGVAPPAAAIVNPEKLAQRAERFMTDKACLVGCVLRRG